MHSVNVCKRYTYATQDHKTHTSHQHQITFTQHLYYTRLNVRHAILTPTYLYTNWEPYPTKEITPHYNTYKTSTSHHIYCTSHHTTPAAFKTSIPHHTKPTSHTAHDMTLYYITIPPLAVYYVHIIPWTWVKSVVSYISPEVWPKLSMFGKFRSNDGPR